MAYLGVPPQSGFITTAKQRITSSTNNYVDLDHAISNLSDVIVWVNFVKQDSTNLSLTTSTRITLGGTLVSSDIVEIAYLGKAVATQTPDTGTVTNDMLAGSITNSKLAGSIANDKLANSSITLNGSAVSLGGSATIGSDAGTEGFKVVLSSNQSPSEGVWTKVQFDTEIFDAGNNFSSYKYTAPSTGTYLFNVTLSGATDGSYGLDNFMAQFYKNGSLISGSNSIFGLPTHTGSGSFDTGSIGWTIYQNASANDYFEVYARINRNGNASTQNFYSDNSRRTEFSGFRVT